MFYRYYQVRTTLKTSTRVPAKIEVTLPKATGNFASIFTKSNPKGNMNFYHHLQIQAITQSS
jgi:hypothetical protein